MRLEPFEQRLKEYFDQVQPSEELIERLKRLEASVEAKPQPRRARRWLLPAAAAVMALVALGSAWAYLRLPGKAPEPAATQPTLSSVNDYEAPALEEPAASAEPAAPAESYTVEQGAPAESPAPAAPEEDEPPAPQTPAAPEPQTPVPAAPSEPAADPEEPHESSEPGETTQTDPPVSDPDIKIEPGEQTEEPDPNLTPESPPPISAEYLYEDGLEALILMNLNTGETVTVDVTGKCQMPVPQQSDPDPIAAETASAAGMPTAIGFCEAFGWPVRYMLKRIDQNSAYAVAEALNMNDR